MEKKYYVKCHGYHAFMFNKHGIIADSEGRFIVDNIALCESIISECEEYILNGINIVKKYAKEDGDSDIEIAENIILSVFSEFVNEQKVKELTVKCKNILQTQYNTLLLCNEKTERIKLAIEESDRFLKNMNNLEIKVLY